MLLSFHPLVNGDLQINCAGRDPNASDLEAVRRADAIILPQGCRQPLYEMARSHTSLIFPNYDCRFRYPGKLGQAKLFAETGSPHPLTFPYAAVTGPEGSSLTPADLPDALTYPLVLKFNWGGEGDTAFKVDTPSALSLLLKKIHRIEQSGQKGFLLQPYIPHNNRTLRVVVVGRTMRSYWRVAPDEGVFGACAAKGAAIDHDAAMPAQKAGMARVREFCRKTGVDLAGFDLIFPDTADTEPLFLEINYFFGRRGLGGTEAYYRLLLAEIAAWTSQLRPA